MAHNKKLPENVNVTTYCDDETQLLTVITKTVGSHHPHASESFHVIDLRYIHKQHG
jgi:hypothetical protein